MTHIPVLLKEAVEILNPSNGDFFIDGTLGLGGHAREIAKRIGKKGTLLAIDWDGENIKRAESEIRDWEPKVILANDNFADLNEILDENALGKADGLLLDLGFSSEQLEKSGKGFSFLKDEILDMRYEASAAGQPVRRPESGLARRRRSVERQTAAEIINSFREEDLAEIFWRFGEERFSRKIAKEIVVSRRKKKILTTFELVEIIKKSVPKKYEKGRIHPATRTFQALRIYVNSELENLEKVLSDLENILKPGKKAAIISFHSLEDRLVKDCFRKMAREGRAKILTKKPITASEEELKSNPRARSAKMRAISLANY